MRPLDLTRKTFGRLTVLHRVGSSPLGKTVWSCRCECGEELVVVGSNLTSGNTESCGCLHLDTITRHGGYETSEYRIWDGMKGRCLNPDNDAYGDYGGRGIRVCDRWRDSFAAFLEDVGPRPSPLHSLDRIDVNGHYEPNNVRWATHKVQQRNRRNNRMVTFRGETRCLSEWAEIVGIDERTLFGRLRAGWEIERAMTEPIHACGRGVGKQRQLAAA